MDPYSVVFRNLQSVELQRHSVIKFPLSQLLNYHKKKLKKLKIKNKNLFGSN